MIKVLHLLFLEIRRRNLLKYQNIKIEKIIKKLILKEPISILEKLGRHLYLILLFVYTKLVIQQQIKLEIC